MALFFHPDIVQLIDTADEVLGGRDQWINLAAAVARAQQLQDWQWERFLYFRQGQEKTPDSEEIAGEVAQDFQLRGKLLQSIDDLCRSRGPRPELQALVLALLRASQRITKGSEELERLDSTRPLAPFPLLHDFLRAANNVHSKLESPQALGLRLKALVGWVKDLEADWGAELELFENLRPLDEEFQAILEEVKEGVGAVYHFLASGDYPDLAAGTESLSEAAQELARFIAQAQAAAADEAEHSPYREIERWAVRRLRMGPEDQATQQAKGEVETLLQSHQAQLEGLGEIPFDSEEYLAAFEELEAVIDQEFAAFEADEFEALCGASQNHELALDRVSATLAEASVDLDGAPALQELRRLVLAVYYKQAPRRFLRSLLDTLVPGFQRALVAESQQQAKNALALCLQACEHAISGLDEESLTDFVDAWRLLNTGGAALLAVQEQRLAQEAAEAEQRKVPCLACGLRNEPTAMTCACGVRLVLSTERQLDAAAEVNALSLKEGVAHSPQATPASENLAQLLGLAERIEAGLATPTEIAQTVEPHLARVQALLESTPATGKARFFRHSVEKFRQAVDKLAAQAEVRDADSLAQGVELLLEAGQELETFRTS